MHLSFLEKYYFINSFEPNLIKSQDKNTIIIYRNYTKNDLTEIIAIRNFCKKNKYRFLLSNNIKLALQLDLNGAYIPSFNQKYDHLSYSFKKKFILIGSAHNLREITVKEKQKVTRIFLSSLFKENENYLGMNRFKILSTYSKNKFIALGGLNKKNLKKLHLLNIKGFAGIDFFKKKGP
tara:strand:+ start:249 stop:785 length:537 start_codon:yes stop_codon:yes gene_type:complete